MPWSFYSTIATFGVFFFCLNVYILTKVFSHPMASEFWLIGVVAGLIGLLYSIRMVRIHQEELIQKKKNEESMSEDLDSIDD